MVLRSKRSLGIRAPRGLWPIRTCIAPGNSRRIPIRSTSTAPSRCRPAGDLVSTAGSARLPTSDVPVSRKQRRGRERDKPSVTRCQRSDPFVIELHAERSGFESHRVAGDAVARRFSRWRVAEISEDVASRLHDFVRIRDEVLVANPMRVPIASPEHLEQQVVHVPLHRRLDRRSPTHVHRAASNLGALLASRPGIRNRSTVSDQVHEPDVEQVDGAQYESVRRVLTTSRPLLSHPTRRELLRREVRVSSRTRRGAGEMLRCATRAKGARERSGSDRPHSGCGEPLPRRTLRNRRTPDLRPPSKTGIRGNARPHSQR